MTSTRRLVYAAKRATRDANSIDVLKVNDRLSKACVRGAARMLSDAFDHNAEEPPYCLVEYYARKREAIRACYWRQRYGRDYYARNDF